MGRDHTQNLRLSNPAVFFRSLATMIAAGIAIHEALQLLADSEDDPNSAQLIALVGQGVCTGRTLSICLADFPRTFTPYLVGLIRVGEMTGSLVTILETIAVHGEKSEALRMKLKSSITYPAVLVAGSFLMLLVGPSWLLEGQLTMLRQSGQPLPTLTRLMILWTEVCKSPLFIAALGLAAGALYSGLRSKRRREALFLRLHQVPVLSNLLVLAAAARFSRALEIALRAGLPILQALPLSAAATGDPLLIRRMEVVKKELIAGDTLAQALSSIAFFPPTFFHLVESGEESGKLPTMLALIADFSEMELDLALKQATTLVEPLLLMVMGIFTALVLVATLQPTISLLQVL